MSTSRSDEVRDYSFADQVLALRKRIGLTQQDLADILGVSCQSIHAWESGLSYPAMERLKQIITLYLDHGAFAAGHEEDQASALWATVRERASRRTLPFDTEWFASLKAENGAAHPRPRVRRKRVEARSAHVARAATVPGSLPVQDPKHHNPNSEHEPANGHHIGVQTGVQLAVAPVGIFIKVKDAMVSHKFYSAFGSAFTIVPVRAYGDSKFARQFAKVCPNVDCRPRKHAGIIYNIVSRGGQRARLEVSEGHPDVPAAVHESDMATAKVSIRLEVDSLAEVIRAPAYQAAARRALTSRGGFVKSYNWGTIEAPVRDPDGVVIVFVVHWDQRDPSKEEEIKQAINEIEPPGSIRWIDERTVTEFPEDS